VDPQASIGLQILVALNSVVNPLIYAYQMPAYRFGFK